MVYWGSVLPTDALQACLDKSYNLGLYKDLTPKTNAGDSASKPTQIGLARLITDYVTFAYLTDVYVVEEEQGKGLGKWLIKCVDEVLKDMEHLRRAMLLTGEGGPENFYERELGMSRLGSPQYGTVVMNRDGEAAALKLQRKEED